MQYDDEIWMQRAIDLSWKCPPSDSAYSVGAVLVHQGELLSTGYSRETDLKVHAEESALAKLDRLDQRLRESTIYTTLEPCSQRASRPKPCVDLILESQIPRVVIAWREPSLFVENCVGVERLVQSGVEVVELEALADEALRPNSHLRTDG